MNTTQWVSFERCQSCKLEIRGEIEQVLMKRVTFLSAKHGYQACHFRLILLDSEVPSSGALYTDNHSTAGY